MNIQLIADSDAVLPGGNQNWFIEDGHDRALRDGGCGIIAAADFVIACADKFAGSCVFEGKISPEGIIGRADAVAFYKQFAAILPPMTVKLGKWTKTLGTLSGQVERAVRQFSQSCGVNSKSYSVSSYFFAKRRYAKAAAFIERSLENGRPVILSTFLNKKAVMLDENGQSVSCNRHFVTIVGTENGAGKTLLVVSWGKIYRIENFEKMWGRGGQRLLTFEFR